MTMMTMTMSRDSRTLRTLSRTVWIGAATLACLTRPVAGQALQVAGIAGDAFVPQNQDVPQDVRIMRTIVSTALSQVEAPAMPKEMAGDSTAGTTGWGHGASFGYSGSRGSTFFGGSDVSGFYMKGYGYLFTVHWPVSSLAAVRVLDDVSGVRAGKLRALPDAGEPSSDATAWAKQYRERLANALRDVIAGYGSTLRRAGPGESITFIADFGGGDDETVTMTVKADALKGTDMGANTAAIRISTGQSGTSGQLRTQLKIMSQIIDTALRGDGGDGDMYVLSNAYFGGSAEPQYVPGYGVIFRKNARLNTSRTFVAMSKVPATRVAADSSEAAARKTYRAHLDTLRLRTAEILATYGPTLTQLKGDDWVGLYYDVGSAAALLNGGMDDYLVQARMGDIRQAAGRGDAAAWLEAHLVTNEKEE
jgi:hypothetical protein